MHQHTQTKPTRINQEDRTVSIEILNVLIRLGITNYHDGVTIERLQLEGVDHPRLQTALDRLVGAGFVCRIDYQPSGGDGIQFKCQPTSGALYKNPRYCLSSGFSPGQFDS
jgi:hypothetical protein